jgi:hypothetical protein
VPLPQLTQLANIAHQPRLIIIRGPSIAVRPPPPLELLQPQLEPTRLASIAHQLSHIIILAHSTAHPQHSHHHDRQHMFLSVTNILLPNIVPLTANTTLIDPSTAEIRIAEVLSVAV